MLRYALKLLWRDRLRFSLTALGVAVAVLLMMALGGVFAGSARQLTHYIEQLEADVFVAQAGVRNMHMASSVLPDNLGPRLEAIPGVGRALPMGYFATNVEAAGTRHLAYVLGLPSGAAFSGAWRVDAGQARAGPGEAVVPAEIAREHGLGLGDTVQVGGRELRIAGLAREVYTFVSSFVFISLEDARALRGNRPVAAYYLLQLDPGADPDAVAAQIQAEVDGVSALSRAELARSDREIALQMGVNILQAMAIAGFLVGLAAVGLSIYAAAVEQLRQFSVMKAVGAGSGYLLGTFLLQALTVSLAGFVLGTALTLLLRQLVPALVPGLQLELDLSYVAATLARVVAIAVLAALPPWWRVSRLDPMQVFRT